MLNQIIERLINACKRPSPLSENGERIDINLGSKPFYMFMDMYQKSHYQRYLFARQYVRPEMVCGDFACGSGYGSVMMAEIATKVVGIDIQKNVIDAISQRYSKISNVSFISQDLRNITFDSEFDLIASFETIEHLKEPDAIRLINSFSKALKPGGVLIFSTPFLQVQTPVAIQMGFHLAFDIDETKIRKWIGGTELAIDQFFYQNYKSHRVVPSLTDKEFLICTAKKNKATK